LPDAAISDTITKKGGIKDMADYKQLIQMARAGSDAAKWAVFSNTVGRVFFIALKVTGDGKTAVRTSAEVYRLAFENLGRLTYPEAFPTWLDRIAAYLSYNAAADRLSAPGNEQRLTEAVAFFRSFQKMSDKEIAEMMHVNPRELPGPGAAAEKYDPDSLLIAPDSVRAIWEEIHPRREPARPEHSRRSEEGERAAEADSGYITISDIANEYLRRERRAIAVKIAGAAALICAFLFAALFFPLRFLAGEKSREAEELYKSGSDGRVQLLAEELSSQLSGQVGEIYKLSEDTYYVVIYLGGEASGSAIVRYGKDDELPKVVSTGSKVLGKDKIAELSQDQYMQVLFNRASSGKGGSMIGDAAAAAGSREVELSENSLVLLGGTLESMMSSAKAEQSKLEELLGDDGEDFNLVLRISCRNVDMDKPVLITLDRTISDAIGEAGEVQIIINDQHYRISLSREQLLQLCGAYGTVALRFTRLSDRRYEINFYGPDGSLIRELFGSMIFTLPAEGPLSYVYATYASGTEARGGIYDAEESTMTFPVTLSGIYEMIGGDTEISDLDEMDEETAEAAHFLVSLQFFRLDGSNAFRPSGSMTRKEYVNTIGRMFLMTDDSYTSAFTDVDLSDPEYDYISSGAVSEILTGLGDGSFGGDAEITREDALVICGRTLRYRLGADRTAVSGEESGFEDSDEISAYAKDAAALCVRYGIADAGGKLRPGDAVRRGEAALWLYRMYRLLYGI
jgi:hypothetical protein